MPVLTSAPTTRFRAPDDTTAPAPAEARGVARDGVRLLVANGTDLVHAHFRDLPDHLEPGDLVVINNSATVAGQIDGHRRGHGAVVVHAATPLNDGTWVIELRTAPDASSPILDADVGERIQVGRVTLTLLGPYPRPDSSPTGVGDRLWRARADGDLSDALGRHGRAIAYGYLDRRYPLSDYQSVFSTVPGSAEMPSAGRPFTDSVITRLVAGGVGVAPITLHTGVSSQEAGEAPQAERFAVPEATARLVNATRATGARVIAVGTTVTRALESAVTPSGRVEAAHGWTERVISPEEPARVVDGLITGWHDPHASHLLLVESIAGADLTQAAYDAAVDHGYLWHEFGDSALLLPSKR
ncbi:queuosine biosynthesis protein [Knoellia sinensis KCTC 19936]|uniref:Queuosine biosynthesis protein n=1 Tax=Knoellia sinensis KCTC 19936 TaxID=1385520 RepID=A0A0A0JDR1_9MICO|nr:S-adenosylmethionine:tRNA ribosyltransferase-isomerase [Knoellia sinensis]KGN34177.1 queuosine biosynthesis protein [Knoellia sinensis KCTC 19936]